MAEGPGLHTRIVTILKVGFPVLAAGLLLSIFVLRPAQEAVMEIVFSEADLDQLGKGMQITNPTFTGTTRNGDAFRFVAALVEPDAAPPTRADISKLSGELDFTDGAQLSLSADSGDLRIAERSLDLAGSVRVRVSDGYQLAADRLTIDLSSGVLTGQGNIVGTGPMGTINSETLRVEPVETAAADRRFLFGNGVHLVYGSPRDITGSSSETMDPSR
jgi:lipopolysaccharide export system protein LptC